MSSIFCKTAEHQRACPGSASPTSRPLLHGNRWTWAFSLLPGHFWYFLLDLSCCTHSRMKYHWGQRIKRFFFKKRTTAVVRAVRWDRGDFFSAQSTNCPKNRSDWVPSFYFPMCTWSLPSLWVREYYMLASLWSHINWVCGEYLFLVSFSVFL